MRKKNNTIKVSEVDVYLERRKSRDYVGKLFRAKNEAKPAFQFEYSEAYLLKRNAIPLGPEFPLTRRLFKSYKLFPSFEDRIPSRQNPAYAEYCLTAGISDDETDPLVLITSIGRRGPSSFVFEPREHGLLTGQEIAKFRKDLALTIREFAVAFGTSPASIQKLEIGKGSGRELMKRLEIYVLFPEVALYEIKKNRSSLHIGGYQRALARLEAQLKVQTKERQEQS